MRNYNYVFLISYLKVQYLKCLGEKNTTWSVCVDISDNDPAYPPRY